MRIRAVRTLTASPDGITIVEYREGVVYELPPRLSEIFLREGWGILEDGPKEQPAVKPRATKPAKPAESPARKPAARKARTGK